MKLVGKSWRTARVIGETPSSTRRPRPTVALPSKATVTIAQLELQLRAAQLPLPEREYRFAPPRRWKFDACWPTAMLALELEGLVFPEQPRWNEPAEHRLSGRHVSVTGFLNDVEKYGEAFALGYSLLRCTHRDIETGRALLWLERRLRR